MRGLFIVFEGGEGSGKTTQVKRLCQRLNDAGRNPVSLREPGGTPLGETVRNLLKHTPEGTSICPNAELFLFEAARAQIVEDVIAPSLEKGMDVICDRYTDSTVAYQGFARGLDIFGVRFINDFATAGYHIDGLKAVPDITFWLDIDPEIGLARTASKRAGQGKEMDRMERAGIGFHVSVRNGYWELSQMRGSVMQRMDASKSESDLEEEIWAKVLPMLPQPPAVRT